MTNQDYFYIRDTRSLGVTECPVCGDRFSPTNIAIFDGNHEPLCDLCAWDRAPEFASLVNLNAAAHYHSMGGTPNDVFHALEKRKSDPKRLKRELKEAHKSLHDNGVGPLAELVAGQVKAALDSGKVETMIKAKALVEETRSRVPTLDDEIPF